MGISRDSTSFLGPPAPPSTKPYMRTGLRKGPFLLEQSSFWKQLIWGYLEQFFSVLMARENVCLGETDSQS